MGSVRGDVAPIHGQWRVVGVALPMAPPPPAARRGDMSDARLFPGWDTMIWLNPTVMGECWGSTTPGYRPACADASPDVVMLHPNLDPLVEDLCRDYSMVADGPFLEAIDGEIVAEWWRGGRFAVREAYP